MTDIRTVEEHTLNDEYEIRVAENGDAYEAAVVATKDHRILSALKQLTEGEDSMETWSDVENAPVVHSEQKYIAVGKAVEAYIQMVLREQEDDNDDD